MRMVSGDSVTGAGRELFDRPISLPGVDVFYLSGITLAVCRSGLEHLLALLRDLRRENRRVVLDPNYRPALWRGLEQARECYRVILPYCDTVLPTLDDDVLLWGADTVDACQEFYRSFGASEVVVKAPDLCAHGFSAGEREVVRAIPVEAVDTTGAGDAFAAGYLAARVGGQNMRDAIVAGQRIAAQVVACRGVIIPRASMA